MPIDYTPVRGCCHAADVDSLYDGFDVIGLQYGPGYRTLLKAWSGVDALARLRVRSTQEGTQVHPADLDDAFCTSSAMAMGGGGETRLPFAVDNAQLQGTSGKLWAVRAFCSPCHSPFDCTTYALPLCLAHMHAGCDAP